jgi:hypothetical protein
MRKHFCYFMLFFLFLFYFSFAHAAWYHPEWRFRKEIKILNLENDSALVDYPIMIEITGNKSFKSDFGDLRFTDDDGAASLNYWIEDYSPGLCATAWVRVPYIPAHGKTSIYLYYGNANANDQSNGKETFYFFDDFNDCDISDWNIISGTWHANNAFLEQMEYAIRRKILSSFSITKPVIVKASLNHITGDPVCGVHIIFSKTADCNNGYYFGYAGINRGGSMISRIIDGNVVELVTNSTIQNSMYPNEWLKIAIYFKGNGIYDMHLEAPDGNQVSLDVHDTVWQKPYILGLWVGDHIGCDNLYVYKYTGHPPKISIGKDEKNLAPIGTDRDILRIDNVSNKHKKLSFFMPFSGNVTISIYDISGRKIDQLLDNEILPAGNHTMNLSRSLKSGIYFIRYSADLAGTKISESAKMVFLQ